ncbi:MAG: ATP synthase subunit I [Coprobacillus sp.]
MNEKDVEKESLKVFFAILLFSIVIGIMLKSYIYSTGVIVGYIINVINFKITIKTSDMILKSGQNVLLVILMYILKMILMVLGFALGVIFKEYIHIFGVFFGYLITPITIYWLNFKTRKEES